MCAYSLSLEPAVTSILNKIDAARLHQAAPLEAAPPRVAVIDPEVSPSMSSRSEDYALICDCETASLVSRGGSIDWLCWPRFDTGARFAALLGEANNGRWSVAPAAGLEASVRVRRRYRGNTLISARVAEFVDLFEKGAPVPLRARLRKPGATRLFKKERGMQLDRKSTRLNS